MGYNAVSNPTPHLYSAAIKGLKEKIKEIFSLKSETCLHAKIEVMTF
jgi:hypothetical protein